MALAGGGHQQALWGATLVVTMTSVAAWAALNMQQFSGGIAPLTMEAFVTAALAARIPQPAPDGAAFAVVMASVAAGAALDPQLTPDGADFVA